MERYKTAKTILDEVIKSHRVSKAMLTGRQRGRKIAEARHEAYFRLYNECGLSQPQIAKMMGRSDHSSVCHGIKKHEERQKKNDIDWSLVRSLKNLGITWSKIKIAIDYPARADSLSSLWSRKFGERVTEKSFSPPPPPPVVLKEVWCDYSTENLPIKRGRPIDCRFITPKFAASGCSTAAAACVES